MLYLQDNMALNNKCYQSTAINYLHRKMESQIAKDGQIDPPRPFVTDHPRSF